MTNPSTVPLERIVIATRESALALWQARHIERKLRDLYPHLQVDILGMTTSGDQMLGTSLSKVGGKGLFVKELEQALTDGRADIAVHSVKDVPMELPEGFILAAIGEREDARDAFISNSFKDLQSMPVGSIVGTSSLRRQSQLKAMFPALVVKPLRGNVQTRLRKLDQGEYAAIILAAAGLKRLALDQRITALLSIETSLPAVGQGALGIECLSRRADLINLLAPLNHSKTALCVAAERAVSKGLGGSCQIPLAAYAEISGDQLMLRGLVASPDGVTVLRGELTGNPDSAETIGLALAKQLIGLGAEKILAAL